jgi:hypothetical protein
MAVIYVKFKREKVFFRNKQTGKSLQADCNVFSPLRDYTEHPLFFVGTVGTKRKKKRTDK